MTRFVLASLAIAALTACGTPQHMQYDYSRSYETAFSAQADRSRPGAAAAIYELNGVEGLEIRARAQEETTNTESGDAEYVDEVAQ